ncbi:hypothetical protein MCEMIH16_02933 [Caulobacteraceae bacterium]
MRWPAQACGRVEPEGEAGISRTEWLFDLLALFAPDWFVWFFALAGLASFGCALVWAAATGNRPLLRKLWGFARPVVIVGGGFAIVIAILLATR